MSKVFSARLSDELSAELKQKQADLGINGEELMKLCLDALVKVENERKSTVAEQAEAHLQALSALFKGQASKVADLEQKNDNQSKIISDLTAQLTSKDHEIEELKAVKAKFEQVKAELEDTKGILKGYETLNAEAIAKVKVYENLFKLMGKDVPSLEDTLGVKPQKVGDLIPQEPKTTKKRTAKVK